MLWRRSAGPSLFGKVPGVGNCGVIIGTGIRHIVSGGTCEELCTLGGVSGLPPFPKYAQWRRFSAGGIVAFNASYAFIAERMQLTISKVGV
jgi:hypothetical protein